MDNTQETPVAGTQSEVAGTQDNQQKVAETPAQQGEQQSSSPWYEGLAQENKDFLINKGYHNIESKDEAVEKIISSFQNLEKFKGFSEDDIIRKPNEHNQESMDEFYDKLGRPSDPNGYEIPERLKEDPIIGDMSEIFHGAGLSKEAGEKVLSGYTELMEKHQEKLQADNNIRAEQELNDLKREWGSSFDKRVSEAKAFAQSVGISEEVIEMADKNGIGRQLIEAMFKGSQHTASDTTATNVKVGMTVEEAISEKNSLLAKVRGDSKKLNGYNKGISDEYDRIQILNRKIAEGISS